MYSPAHTHRQKLPHDVYWGSPADFKAYYLYVRDKFDEAGVTNAVWARPWRARAQTPTQADPPRRPLITSIQRALWCMTPRHDEDMTRT